MEWNFMILFLRKINESLRKSTESYALSLSNFTYVARDQSKDSSFMSKIRKP